MDLTTAHVVAAAARLVAYKTTLCREDVEKSWEGGEAVAFLSVRSAFTALLEALDWPAGSEILITGINIVDMARIIQSFGHIAVPIDLMSSTLAPDPAEIQTRIGPATRGLVVAHLFGGHIDMAPILDVARRHHLLVVEDSAQAYTTQRASEARQGDVRFFSFGLLKTGTALGGAIAEVGDPGLRQLMRNVQSRWPMQSRSCYAAKVAKAFMFLVLQRPREYAVFFSVCAAAGSSATAVLRRLTRGFGNHDVFALLRALRQQPCAPLLAMLAWRLSNEDGQRVARRKATGERIMASMAGLSEAGLTLLGNSQARHSHWLLPVCVSDPVALRNDLMLAGFDAHGASNVDAIGGSRVTAMIRGLVFLPCYPEMNEAASDQLCGVVRAHCLSRSQIG
ncbi:MAG: DegT/DnrJ/EryC1/StrS family aminotransferase [Gemmatimonadaceae bacterium]